MKKKLLLIAVLVLSFSALLFTVNAQTTNTKVKLGVNTGSITPYVPSSGAELNLGNFSAAFNTGYLSGTFGTSTVVAPFYVEDMDGTQLRDLQFQMSSSVQSAGGATIANTNFTLADVVPVAPSYPTAKVLSGDTSCGVTTSLTGVSGTWSTNGATNTTWSAGAAVSSIVNLLSKGSNNGKVCTTYVKPRLMARIPINQPTGTYTGSITITKSAVMAAYQTTY